MLIILYLRSTGPIKHQPCLITTCLIYFKLSININAIRLGIGKLQLVSKLYFYIQFMYFCVAHWIESYFIKKALRKFINITKSILKDYDSQNFI